MKVILLLFLFIGYSAFSTNYYVSNTGSDTNNGLSTLSPIKTIAKVNTITFSAGDSILFKSANIFDDASLSFSGNGTVGNEIVISTYGGTPKAEIRGYGEVIGWTTSGSWTLHATNVWKMTVLFECNRLWLNGKDKKESQTIAGINTTYPWRCEGTTLYVYSTSNPATYYNSIVNAVKSYTASPSTIMARILNLQNLSNIKIQNIKVTGGSASCMRLTNCKNFIIENCDFGYRANLYAISLLGSGSDSTDNVTLRNNIIASGDSLYYNYFRGTHTTYEGVYIQSGCTNITVNDNFFNSWSHGGVTITALDNSLPIHDINVYDNFITAPLIDYARGMGADYVTEGYNVLFHHNTIVNTSVHSQFNGNGLKFYDNIIDNVIGCPYPEKSGVGCGIALSAYETPAINMEIYNNTIRNCADNGIQVNSYTTTSGNNIHDNNIWNCGDYQIYVYDVAGIENNIYSANHLIGSSADVVYYKSALTASEFNAVTTTNGDVISSNNAILKWGTITESDTLSVDILHNSTASAQLLSAGWPGIDVTTGQQKTTTFSVPAYSSVVLKKNIPNPTGTKKPWGSGGKMYKTRTGLPIGGE